MLEWKLVASLSSDRAGLRPPLSWSRVDNACGGSLFMSTIASDFLLRACTGMQLNGEHNFYRSSENLKVLCFATEMHATMLLVHAMIH
ncbi:hypothetical protein ACLOJK_041543 [Asimina triloba]